MVSKNYYQKTTGYPAHLSVGAVLFDSENKVAGLYFQEIKTEDNYFYGLKDVYFLMRESLELGETLEQAVYRGLMEEMGAGGEIKAFLGSIKTTFEKNNIPIEKTTLCFLVKLISFDESRCLEDGDICAEIKWLPIDELILKMRNQAKRLQIDDLDESEILERAKVVLGL